MCRRQQPIHVLSHTDVSSPNLLSLKSISITLGDDLKKNKKNPLTKSENMKDKSCVPRVEPELRIRSPSCASRAAPAGPRGDPGLQQQDPEPGPGVVTETALSSGGKGRVRLLSTLRKARGASITCAKQRTLQGHTPHPRAGIEGILTITAPFIPRTSVSSLHHYYYQTTTFRKRLHRCVLGPLALGPDPPVPAALTLCTATWLHAPGAAPQSNTRRPGCRMRCLASTSRSLKALRHR